MEQWNNGCRGPWSRGRLRNSGPGDHQLVKQKSRVEQKAKAEPAELMTTRSELVEREARAEPAVLKTPTVNKISLFVRESRRSLSILLDREQIFARWMLGNGVLSLP